MRNYNDYYSIYLWELEMFFEREREKREARILEIKARNKGKRTTPRLTKYLNKVLK